MAADENEEASGDGGNATSRRYCTLAVASIKYLEALSRKGTHGSSVPNVMKTLIEEGIRQAIRDGFLDKRDE